MTGRLGVLCAGQGGDLSGTVRRLHETAPDSGWLQTLFTVIDCTIDDVAAELSAGDCRQEILQPTLAAVAYAQWDAMKDLVPAPVVIAGYSLGELVAAAIGGAMGCETLIALAHQRGALMAAGTSVPTAMVAITGPRIADVEAAAAAAGCFVAIVNGPQESIVTGDRASVAAVAATLAPGAHLTPIDVAVPSHTPLLDDAAQEFALHLAAADLRDLDVPLVRSRDGAVVASKAEVVDTLIGNIHTAVRWDTAMAVIAEMGCDGIVEVGAGAALTHMWTARNQPPWAHAISEFSSDAAAAKWLAAHLNAPNP